MRLQSSALLIAAALVASGQNPLARQIFDRPITAALRLKVIVTNPEPHAGGCCRTVAVVSLVDAGRSWDLVRIAEGYETAFAVARADDRSVVLSRSDPDSGIGHESIKLFFDAPEKRLVKRIDFDPSRDVTFNDAAEAARVLGVAPDAVPLLRQQRVFSVQPGEPVLPTAFERRPLPQSTYQEFARARAERVRNGYDMKGTTIEERIGAYQLDGHRFWFAKTFYDGEGTTGVGGVGFLAAGKYSFLRIPELFDWSVEGLLVEPDTIWAGRVSHGEGADGSGGLLRYDRKTSRARIYDVPDVIHAIAHVGGALFLGTNHGLYVINGTTRMRYRPEPDIDGAFIVVREPL